MIKRHPLIQPRGTLLIRLREDERRLIEAAAAARPTYLTRYIREAALAVARRDLAKGDPSLAPRTTNHDSPGYR